MSRFRSTCAFAAVVALTALMASCSASTDAGSPAASVVVDRIVVTNNAGQVYLVDGAGGNRLDLVESDSVGLQPVWAPNGGRIAWSQRDGTGFSIVSADPDGSAVAHAATPFSGYFGYWDPTSTRLGFLGNAPPGTGLVLDAGEGVELDVVDSDTFYYFSWNPDGTQWVVHSGSGLHIMDIDGARQDIDLADALFRAPVWAPDGKILLAIANAGRNVIVSFDPENGAFKELLEVADIANFVLDPSGRFLAIESIELGDGDEADVGDGITVALGSSVSVGQRALAAEFSDGGQAGDGGGVAVAFQPAAPRAEVLVYDMTTGDVEQVHDGVSGGFWWSPDGVSLAVLVPEDRLQPNLTQWLVWGSQGTFRTDRFLPDRTYLASYVPFFDQYAQAITPWSHDSSRFVYSGIDEAGQPGVFVQAATPETPPVRIIEEAATAFWSPT